MLLREIVDTSAYLRAARDAYGDAVYPDDKQWVLIKAIEKSGCCPSISDVGRLLHVTRQTAHDLVTEAASIGIVELFTPSYDRRIVQVALTAAGRNRLAAVRNGEGFWVTVLLNGLEPPQMQVTTHVLEVIRRRLMRQEEDRRNDV